MSVFPDSRRTSATKLTYDEYVMFPADGSRHEIIDGRHYMNPAPNPRHQHVSRYIHHQLFEQIELNGLGSVIYSPIDLQLSEWDVVQPDLVIVLAANHIITPTKIEGIPDLVIEVLSPSNRGHDLRLKLQLYQQAGIPEYWIVDPEDQSVMQYRLEADVMFSPATVHTESIAFERSGCLAVVDLNRVWPR